MQNFDIDENGFVMLPGSEEWRNCYEDGENLDTKFPGQDAHNFVYAIHYNNEGPLKPGLKIIDLQMLKQGGNDESDWIWKVALSDNETWWMTGWCDYTGWDCQSGNSWTQTDLGYNRHCKTCSCVER
jgi:hypothetical protein